ncbi:MAG: LytTR family DNA-binding domain-containing protein [Bacteroidota bacterium]
MRKIACLIVDDEPIARDIIRTYCQHLPQLEVTGACANAFDAKTLLQKQKIDLLFLDINMPVLDGIAFLRTLKDPPMVIFTTAYKEHAVDAFELAAGDYLLKPFSLERFIIAVDKVLAQKDQPKPDVWQAIFIKAEGKFFKVEFDELLFVEACGNYTKVILSGQSLLPAIPFSGLEAQLPGNLFLRVHRSFIVNRSKITRIDGNRVFINEQEIPISNLYKDAFLKALGIKDNLK